LIHDALDSFPEGYGSDYDIEPLCSKPGFYPKYELQKFIWAVDTAAVLVPRLNKLYKNRNYDGIVASLRSLDTTFYGSILYHRAVFLYHCYSSVDSLILNKYEDEFRKKAQKGSAVKFDSLISQLENTRFLFPHKVALRKRQIIASFAPLSKSGSTSKVVPGNDRDKNSANSMFRCLFYGSEISKDYDFQGITIKKWLCLAPKINHSARECVFTGELSPAGFQITSPRSAIDPYVCNCKSVIKVTDELNPCLFFYNFEGVTEGPVEKAEIYDRGDLCVACIENDSCEFWYDSGRHPHFINATIQDSLYFSGEAGHFIAWIGDVNRNGKIEFIVEHSAPQMEPTVQFVEKSNKNGKIIFETKAAYERNLPEPDIE
jgi:hypothetical protein